MGQVLPGLVFDMTEAISVVHGEGVVSLFLNRPERKNALSLALLGQLDDALSSGIGDQASAVIISGSGGAFSAGADLADLTGTRADLAIDDAIEAVTEKIRQLPVPVIAAIDGPCMGGAFDLAVNCDYRIAAVDAFFQVPAARLGLLYNPRAIVRMRQRLSRDAIFRLLVLGERCDAGEALRLGIVARVVAGESYAAAVKLAMGITGNIRAAMTATKHLLNAIGTDDYALSKWEILRLELLSSPERKAAVETEKKRRGL
jgi:enoyl-CoA hydratase/carnithine racemase